MWRALELRDMYQVGNREMRKLGFKPRRACSVTTYRSSKLIMIRERERERGLLVDHWLYKKTGSRDRYLSITKDGANKNVGSNRRK